MNNYQNPYRTPYPGQGTVRYSHPYGNPSASSPGGSAEGPLKSSTPDDPVHSQTEHDISGQSGSFSQSQGQNTPPPDSARENANWQNDPSLKNMDLKKLAFLSELVAESGNKPLDTLIPFLVAANKNANSMGLQFNDAETSLLLEVLKKHMSPEEQSRIDMLRKMADMLGKNK